MEQQLEQQVFEAGLAMVRSSTDAATRTAASQFLEQWTRTPEAWVMYAKWLHSFRHQTSGDNSHDTIGMQLLCLTLLQAKIRREVPRMSSPDETINSVRQELGQFLQGSQTLHHSVVAPLCICIAALAARCGGLGDLISMCRLTAAGTTSSGLHATNALRILACVPPDGPVNWPLLFLPFWQKNRLCSILCNTRATD